MAGLVVPVEDVARRMGLSQPLSEEDAWRVEQAILDAQEDVEAYLGRPLAPEEFTESGLWLWPDGFHLREAPVVEIVSQTPETYDTGGVTGRWTVTYLAGLDAANDPELGPIRRFIRVHAMNSPDLRKMTLDNDPADGRRVTTLSAEGQSVSYSYDYPEPSPGSLNPGALPSLKSLDRWRLARRRISQKRTDPWAAEPWPHDRPLPGGWWPW